MDVICGIYYVFNNNNKMVIKKANSANFYRAIQNGDSWYGRTSTQALNNFFKDYYWRNNLVKPKTLMEKLFGWTIFYE